MEQAQVIVISGVMGSGKTTLTKALSKSFKQSITIEFDNYNIDQLINAPSIDTPIEVAVNQYDISALIIDLKTELFLNHYIFIDFPFGYRHKELAPFIDFAFYIKTPLDICFARKILRDFNSKNGLDMQEWAETYLSFARPLFLNHELFISDSVDSIIDGTLSTKEQIEIVSHFITQSI